MPPPPYPVIAIDGTAASGKSTFARQLARQLGCVYVNTGAMYRGVTWYLQEKNVPVENAAAVTQAMEKVEIVARLQDGELAFFIAGHDPLPHLRAARVNAGVSFVAQVGEVRRLLVAEQQGLAAQSPLVMEGRDIGTVVFPGTPYKFFLDAALEVRAGRRNAQGEDDVIQQRDVLDRERENSPLTCAPDACRLDSGTASVDELVATALNHLARQGWQTGTNARA